LRIKKAIIGAEYIPKVSIFFHRRYVAKEKIVDLNPGKWLLLNFGILQEIGIK
jgi:hypothetical protein